MENGQLDRSCTAASRDGDANGGSQSSPFPEATDDDGHEPNIIPSERKGKSKERLRKHKERKSRRKHKGHKHRHETESGSTTQTQDGHRPMALGVFAGGKAMETETVGTNSLSSLSKLDALRDEHAIRTASSLDIDGSANRPDGNSPSKSEEQTIHSKLNTDVVQESKLALQPRSPDVCPFGVAGVGVSASHNSTIPFHHDFPELFSPELPIWTSHEQIEKSMVYKAPDIGPEVFPPELPNRTLSVYKDKPNEPHSHMDFEQPLETSDCTATQEESDRIDLFHPRGVSAGHLEHATGAEPRSVMSIPEVAPGFRRPGVEYVSGQTAMVPQDADGRGHLLGELQRDSIHLVRASLVQPLPEAEVIIDTEPKPSTERRTRKKLLWAGGLSVLVVVVVVLAVTLSPPDPPTTPPAYQVTIGPTSEATIDPSSNMPTVEPSLTMTTTTPSSNMPTIEPTVEPSSNMPTIEPSSNMPTVEPSLTMTTIAPLSNMPTIEPSSRMPTMKPTSTMTTIVPPTSMPTTLSPANVPTSSTITMAPTSSTITMAPTSSAPTSSTVTMAPTSSTVTMAPTHATGTVSPTFPLTCYLCGDPSLNITAPGKIVATLLGDVACRDLFDFGDFYTYNASITPGQCALFQSYGLDCGCQQL